MKCDVAGLNERSLEFIRANSFLDTNKIIGCKNSKGVVEVSSSLYKIDNIKNQDVLLFKYFLTNSEFCYEVIQEVINNTLFVKIVTDNGNEIKWSREEIEEYFKTQ